jgi:hypothetical protein
LSCENLQGELIALGDKRNGGAHFLKIDGQADDNEIPL